MSAPLSLLGELHTVISFVPIVAGLYSFARHGGIKPEMRSGQIYLGGLALSVVTSFGLSSTGGFNPGHALGIMALLVASVAILVGRVSFLGRLRAYLKAFGLSFTYFLLWVPGINETLSRLPPSHPIGNGPDSPPVQMALLIWLILFAAGSLLQAWTIHRGHALSRARA
ncbi:MULTISPECIES: hypothetical protein [unclassified Rhizobium]|uniref:hypothetical protein n=1 Tax=unclassified Rhizobium TaxID=2613769 RepID=UPI000CDF524B|nr:MULTISPECIES: hypothetical protein [Rhizobium]AVA20777.1 hypothetical protein NXC24_CH01110 [Rhizobium sp. NXC24]UWU21989.1 hypothetical protein N2601_03135 [Rhizobium tropici]